MIFWTIGLNVTRFFNISIINREKMEVKFSKSTKKDKKMTATFYKDGEKIKLVHFGATGYEDYTTHKDEARKQRYIQRHSNENWNDYMSAGSLARYILWNRPTLEASIKDNLKKFNLKKSKSF